MAEPQYPPLSVADLRRPAEALAAWAEHHPHPNHPAFSFGAGGRAFSPRELANGVLEGGPLRDRMERMVRFAARRRSAIRPCSSPATSPARGTRS